MTNQIETALKAAQQSLWQYQSDLRHPPEGESVERRLDAAASASKIVDATLLEIKSPRADGLANLLKEARGILLNSGAESGYCMCGDPIENHSYSSGHSPVDAHGYVASQIVERIDATLAKLEAQS